MTSDRVDEIEERWEGKERPWRELEHAPEDIAWLLARVRALEEELERLRWLVCDEDAEIIDGVLDTDGEGTL